MAMQFGFITLFSSAFPLAPLCAMINNLFEIRQDAQKYTKYKTRPIPTRVPDIGIWYSIFQFLSVLAVITNVSSEHSKVVVKQGSEKSLTRARSQYAISHTSFFSVR